MSDELAKCPSCEWPLPEDVVTFCGNCGTEFDQENEALPIAPGEQSVACPAAASGDVGPGQAPGRSANGKQQGLATAQVPSPPQQNLASGTAAAAEPSVPQPPVGMEQICLQDGPSEKMETAPMQAAPPTDQETRGTSRPSAERDAQVASFTQPQPQPTGDDIPPLSSQSGRGGPADSPYGASPDDAAEQHGKPSPAGSPEPVEASSDCEELEFAVDVGRFFFEDVVFPVRFALKALHEDLRDVEVTARTIELGTGKEVMLSKTFSRLKAGVAKEGD
ncbi:hypothetical protein HN588_04310, partial [Candidatus Bathyarchaeota archaeon]|nr:hypothetical protein [Candidatus Bathyarchaeota archaeon]